MKKNRVEAFSDGVLAVIITIMVLEMKVPHGIDYDALRPILPIFLSYVLSFLYVGIYWNNHHHMLHTITNVSAGILWANMHLLFWLSLIPFVTGWMGENHFADLPTALYGFVLFMAAISYFLLQGAIIKNEGPDSLLAKAVGHDLKGKSSLLFYFIAIVLSFFLDWISQILYTIVALMWLVPDKRIERVLGDET